ncbi:MAG: 2-hydroxyacyl-CoA dehydratase subunit D [Promethearchaeota archaeon]|jgi:benzoyl-CoA reductase/2-hydroxyglutaryl-CoA dehydratase subunit BcrC/BadD/HgdB
MQDLELLSDFSLFLKEKKDEGKKIIGFISHDNIPEELFDAGGFIPLKLIFGGNDDLMTASHDFLPPSTCAFAQSCIGLFSLKPDFFKFLELLDYFLVSNHCVSDICASEIISKYFNIPRLNFYISYTKNNNSLTYLKLELQDLKQNLETITGDKIKNEDLLNSIKKYNNFKKKLLEFNSLYIKGSEKLKIIQKAMLFGPEFYPTLENIIQKYKENLNNFKNTSKDVILTGCSIFINDYLIDLIEEGGGNIVFFDTWIGNNYFSQIISDELIEAEKYPLNLFVHRYNENIYGDHSVPNFLENKLAQILDMYQQYKQKTGKKLAVINHIIKFCDHISIMSSFFKNKLQDKGIPVLNLERDYSKANKGQLSTRIEAFLEMI